MTALQISRVSPGSTIQDAGRPLCLGYGISASGPMDRSGFAEAGRMLEVPGGTAGLEFTLTGIAFAVSGPVRAAFAGGQFTLSVNGIAHGWPAALDLGSGDRVEIGPGPAGVYGYLRLDREIGVSPVLGSRATNVMARLGGLEGRALQPGDTLALAPLQAANALTTPRVTPPPAARPIRVLPGLHADLLGSQLWTRFVGAEFRITPRLDRMGIRLSDPGAVLAGIEARGLVSDPVVPGDVQVLGDGTPVILMRDHQPSGGYPRIATVISADLDRLAQMRPGTALSFRPVTLAEAQAEWARR